MNACQLLTQWSEQLNAFLLTLDQEFEAFKSNQAERIGEVAHLKSNQLDLLIQTEQALVACSTTKPEAGHLADWLTSICDQQTLVSRIINVTQDIQRNNQRNAMLLQNLMRLNEFGLSLLSGKIKTHDTYGASGQLSATTPISSLTLATA